MEFEPSYRQALTKKVQALEKLGLNDEMIEASELARSILSNNDEVTLTSAQAEWKVNSGKHIDLVNSMLERHGMAKISSNCHSNSLAIEHIQCDTDSISPHKEMVSVIMTVYGKDKYLDVAIYSILNQTHKNLELIIVDDRSTDDAWKYLQDISKKDPRIKLLQVDKNGGTYLAKNLGLNKANGDYIAFMDSDDWTHPQRIECQIGALKSKPNSKAIWHKYFRIDELGNIIFRGKGALRNACISLLYKKEILQKIGYFDSLRVGADTEFIERIQAYFGEDALIEDPIPSMFMLQHSSSLTGGGKFHISWRSITDYRLAHHSSFREWHRKISSGKKSAYMPRILRVRPFNAPEEMLAGDSLWSEGMKMFGEEIQKRNHDWWKGKKSVWQKKLSPKLAGRNFVEELGLKVPDLYWKGKNIEQIPEFDQLPEDFVIKPEKGWSSNNVYCMKNGEDLLSHQPHNRQTIIDGLLNNEFVATNKPTIMIEELLNPEQKQSDDGIPRDFKFYCFGEDIVMIHVALRKSEIHKTKNEHQYYTPEFKIIESRVMENRQQGQIPIDRPDCWDEMVQSAQTIGKALGIYMRIDMFPTNRGAVFGEFTPTPHGGNGYSNFADEYLGSFWKGEEGVERQSAHGLIIMDQR